MKDVHHTLGRSAAALALCFALVAASVTAARAQARIEDCESIQAADAYNQCLAKFGPTSKVKSVEPVKPGDIKDNSAEAAAGAGKGGGAPGAMAATKGSGHGHYRGRRGHGGGHVVSHRRSGKSSGGRKRMTFTIKKR